jgi:drug/metabolite transporter (DMT)-like permease
LQVQQHPIRGYVYIAAAALLWGASATLGKAAFSGILASRGEGLPLDPLILAQSRTTISFLILAPILLLTKRAPGFFRMPRRDVLLCALLGTLGLAASNFFYYFAISKTSVTAAIILQYIAPVWVLLYMVARGLQRATAQRILAVLLAVAGIALALGTLGFSAAPPFLHFARLKVNAAGVIAAELAAMSFAFYNIVGQRLVARHDRWKVLLYALLAAALFWIVINPPWKIFAAHYSGAQWLFLLVFALSSMLVPFSLYFSGLQYLDPTRAIVTSCLEPVFAIIFATMYIHESLAAVQVIGVLVVLAATVLVQIPERAIAPSHA